MKKHLLIFGLIFFSNCVMSQDAGIKKDSKNNKGTFYLALGTHRIFYTKANIHVIRSVNPVFDFTLYKVRGKDEGGFKWETAPQFSYTVGYYFKNKKFGIEYQYDHIKYFIRQHQVVHMKGAISGHFTDKDTTLSPGFFQLEHSDGGNYAMVNIVKWLPLTKKQTLIYPELMIKGGIGVVNPKTNSTILGIHRDDRYYISGYIVGVESGLRFHVGKNFFATGSFKGAYANYNHFLINGGHGKHKWLSGQLNYLIGGQFPL